MTSLDVQMVERVSREVAGILLRSGDDFFSRGEAMSRRRRAKKEAAPQLVSPEAAP